jgi:2-keto-4-pentenoate hydratase
MADALDAILAARLNKQVLAPLGKKLAPMNLEAAYALQLRVARATGAFPPAGFKIGATTKVMQDYLGLPGPAAGFVPPGTPQASGARFRFADFLAVGVECEVAVRLGRDIAPGPTTARKVEAAVQDVMAAIEIVEKRYGDLKELGTPTLVADQVFHAGGVLALPPKDWRQIDLGAMRGEMFIDGASRGGGHGRDLLGHPMEALAWLADSGAAHAFGGLRKGQVVWLGSVIPPLWLDGPCHVEARFEGLGSAELTFS